MTNLKGSSRNDELHDFVPLWIPASINLPKQSDSANSVLQAYLEYVNSVLDMLGLLHRDLARLRPLLMETEFARRGSAAFLSWEGLGGSELANLKASHTDVCLMLQLLISSQASFPSVKSISFDFQHPTASGMKGIGFHAP